MVALWVSQGIPLWQGGEGRRPRLTSKGKAALAICLCTGISGIYYAFFGACFVMLAAVYGSVRARSRGPLWRGVLLCGAMSAVLALSLAPYVMYSRSNGTNPAVGQRSPVETEIYGLRIMQLVLPVSGHRLPLLASLKTRYNSFGVGIPPNENDSVSLGFVGATGFLLLLAWLMFGGADGRLGNILRPLSVFAASAVLLATIGGFGYAFAALIASGVRAYNRISPYIAFFSFFAVALAADEFFRSRAPASRLRRAAPVAFGCMLVFGLWDQIPLGLVAGSPIGVKAEYLKDHSFVQRIEASVPRGAMIFQLPYVPFPEHPPVQRMVDYDLMRGYLNSSTLRWSYGSMKGRYGDLWQRAVVSKPVPAMAEALAFAGFAGIYVDRFGYSDSAADLERQLRAILGIEPEVSANRRLAFFNLAGFNNRLRARYSDTEWRARAAAVLYPFSVEWHGGCGGQEGNAERNWRWCSSDGELWLRNPSSQARQFNVRFLAATGDPQPANLLIEGPGVSEVLSVSAAGTPYAGKWNVLPGRQVFRFRCDARRLVAPGDPRRLIVRFENFKAEAGSDTPLRMEWGGGFSGFEQSPGKDWRWCAHSGELRIDNPSSGAREIRLQMNLALGAPGSSPVRIEGPAFSEEVKTDAGGRPFSIVLKLPPGKSAVRFASDAKPLAAPGDPRTLVFRVEDFRYYEPGREILVGN